MIAYSDDKKPVYETDKAHIRIHWDYEQVVEQGDSGQRVFWKYEEAIIHRGCTAEEMLASIMSEGLDEASAQDLVNTYFQ